MIEGQGIATFSIPYKIDEIARQSSPKTWNSNYREIITRNPKIKTPEDQ